MKKTAKYPFIKFFFMKTSYLAIVTSSVFLLFGCQRSDEPSPQQEKVRVKLSASIKAGKNITRGEGLIAPVNGLPPRQLEIGIITVERAESSIPEPIDWNDVTTYPDRGLFGGDRIGEDPISDGNIEYTDQEGNVIQQLFYDDTGIYYFLVAMYPYAGSEIDSDLILDDTGASIIIPADGSQDIMASTLGWGNKDNPIVQPLVFSHQLTCLKYKIFAESDVAADLYGDIAAIELTGQPDYIGLNIGLKAIGEEAIFDAAEKYIDYPTVDFPDEGNRELLPIPANTDGVGDFGYVLAMPKQTYTFRITTEKRGSFYATYDFSENSLPAIPQAGVIYCLTFRMMESAEIELTAAEAEEWWIDQTFD